MTSLDAMPPIRLKSGRVVRFTLITEGEFAGAFHPSCNGADMTDAEWQELDRILVARQRAA